MQLSDLASTVCGSKHSVCERCHREAELKCIKVKTFDGSLQYKYLCPQCAAMEKLIKF